MPTGGLPAAVQDVNVERLRDGHLDGVDVAAVPLVGPEGAHRGVSPHNDESAGRQRYRALDAQTDTAQIKQRRLFHEKKALIGDKSFLLICYVRIKQIQNKV